MSASDGDTGPPGPPEETVTEVGRRRLHIPDTVARGLLALLLLGLILWVLLSNVGDLEAVAEALAGVSWEAAVLLIALLLATQVVIASQLAFTVPGLGVTRAVVTVESAAAVSNTVPGPSGTATRLGILRSWGFYTDDFARSWLFTSSLTNLVVLVMPVLAIIIAAALGEVTTGVVVLAVIGGVASVVGIVLVWLMLRSETFSRRIGTLAGRFARWARGVVSKRPSERDFAEAAVRFRDGLRATWRENGGRVSLAVVAAYGLNALMLSISMRAVGLGYDVLPVGSIVVVYAFVRLLTIVNLTPGGVGVVEALYVSGFLLVATGADESQIVAGVFLFRGLTYVGPILLGVVGLLIWKLRSSWRVPSPPEPVGAAGVGAVIADREPPGPGAR
ncbi:lysylphosphatidylglycerol synthase transmembrane domain-containing protein [Miltoncostaea oceani]|uniref:lysylphosphatidylglycerol synthase transmembrane domain-containing protein n=1 Tax=Miltoncostaea oceani TaxID=2843216 RepID=UPI001C3DF47C|nr:YbhN family protein [Miltoncostaea oceani]